MIKACLLLGSKQQDFPHEAGGVTPVDHNIYNGNGDSITGVRKSVEKGKSEVKCLCQDKKNQDGILRVGDRNAAEIKELMISSVLDSNF